MLRHWQRGLRRRPRLRLRSWQRTLLVTARACGTATNAKTDADAVTGATYRHAEVEARWQRHWEEQQTFRTGRFPRDAGRKKYILDMFPYPSGAGLHVGHPLGYTATDVVARYWRMRGYDVMHPMGWDAFGLPAEQHAVLTGTHPAETTAQNIDTFRRQLKALGFSYDWSREIATTDTDYVRWTQWIFLQLFRCGLAEQRDVPVNWCPALGTVLANEEIIDGKSERGGHPVVRTPLRQWVLKITQYADRLEDDLGGLDWPTGTMALQDQWIGRSHGMDIEFPLVSAHPGQARERDSLNDRDTIRVFTTRPDTLLGVTYLVLAPEHPLVPRIVSDEQREAVLAYVESTASKSDMDRTEVGEDVGKTGVFLGAFAEHPLTGDPVPIWTADYVLGDYGSGAVMAVPAHDERDYAFAHSFGLPVRQVIQEKEGEGEEEEEEGTPGSGPPSLPCTGHGTMVNCGGEIDGMESLAFLKRVRDELTASGKGQETVSFKLRDWVFSRQRYWGEPIPIYYPVECADDADPRRGDPHTIRYDQPIAVSEDDLPLNLPALREYSPGEDVEGCLARATEWRYFRGVDTGTEPGRERWFARETNTMPQWAGSCWYYLRFLDPRNPVSLCDDQVEKAWMPVDLYVGGQEHAVLHLLYARFWHKVLFDIGVVSQPEPFRKLVHQGMILASDGEKMSKSRGNVINPDVIVAEHGADCLRMYELFLGPLEAVKVWQTKQLAGVERFRNRVYHVATQKRHVATPALLRTTPDELDVQWHDTAKLLHRTVQQVTAQIESMSFNTAISALMVLCKHLNTLDAVPLDAVRSLVLMVSPFAPHLGEECWDKLKLHRVAAAETLAPNKDAEPSSLAYEAWPPYQKVWCEENNVTVAVQVNGKVRGHLELSADAAEDEAIVMSHARNLSRVQRQLEGKTITRVVHVPGRALNLIVQ